MNAALELLKPHVAAKTVLDVGCASGRFAVQLLEAGASKVYGVDISAEAVKIANEYRERAKLKDRLEFSIADIVQPGISLPQSDIVTALGVIEYFDADALSVFLGNLNSKWFFFDFPDTARRKQFPIWQLRQVYVRVNKLPGIYLYKPQEFKALASPCGFRDIWVAERDGFYYITNLPRG